MMRHASLPVLVLMCGFICLLLQGRDLVVLRCLAYQRSLCGPAYTHNLQRHFPSSFRASPTNACVADAVSQQHATLSVQAAAPHGQCASCRGPYTNLTLVYSMFLSDSSHY